MNDLFSECFESKLEVSVKDFKAQICAACRNHTCVNAGLGQETAWLYRMATQEGVLFNPTRANPDLPHFRGVLAAEFKDMTERALQLVIADNRGDWVVPDIRDGVPVVEGASATAAVDRALEALRLSQAVPMPVEDNPASEPKPDLPPAIVMAPDPPVTPQKTPVKATHPQGSPQRLVQGASQTGWVQEPPATTRAHTPPVADKTDPWAPPPTDKIKAAAKKVSVGGTVILGGGGKSKE